ncbi:lactonase family protein [Leptospira bandrabouensis]|uniref:lactonase family protein n=1 Tax=Leptospira bandrabouensis TaxID=2484903 RepID=UPI001EE7ECF6|nr:beta-propeller fold lactonase family protein [Leptospira bandrabouensis]MCG6142941.1 lactonase family protein [Leptospira bandrabouensis]MCG6162536.1 lactonase family protein [Leptospira bandrabouensis]
MIRKPFDKHWRNFLFICLIPIFVFQCRPNGLKNHCDPNQSSYLQNLTLLLGVSESAYFCGNLIQSPFLNKIKIPRFIIVTNVGLDAATSSISVFRINPNTGEISQVSGSPFQLSNRPRFTVTNSTGTVVYVPNIGNKSVSVLNLNPETGSLSLKHPDLVLSSTPYSLALDPNGKYLYASSEQNPEIHRMAIGSNDNLTILSPAMPTSNPSGGSVGRLSFDSKGNHLYVGLTSAPGNNAGIQVFSLDPSTGNLSSINVYITGINNLSLGISPNGKFVYGSNYSSENVFPFVRDINSGTLSIQTSISAGVAPGYTIVDPLNRFVYVANSGTGQGTISAYLIEPSNGTLTPVNGSPFSTGFSPIGLCTDPRGKFLYSSNTEGGNISGFSVGENGVLTPLSGFPVTAGTNPFSIEMVSY